MHISVSKESKLTTIQSDLDLFHDIYWDIHFLNNNSYWGIVIIARDDCDNVLFSRTLLREDLDSAIETDVFVQGEDFDIEHKIQVYQIENGYSIWFYDED